ncbi:nitrogen-fixing NifU domain protein [Fibrella aestuarina BUZ 2]|uniref:Nitrogen-fixing NifU domain protein n=1 Tax=Fibrella aestuarina BUZ 2 TaxID=1166018 RepID=I0KF96_9BACT|nr:NifU family protein [Fibrella aestuarina]CCH02799.1 nitrogen-fixing NifU domain protein [Fibrella aestuarina BUZ 2]
MQAETATNPLIDRVEKALDSMRPYLAADGGNVRVLDVTAEGVARLELMGSCGSCPMSAMTFKGGLEDAILRAVPEINRVEAVNLSAMPS